MLRSGTKQAALFSILFLLNFESCSCTLSPPTPFRELQLHTSDANDNGPDPSPRQPGTGSSYPHRNQIVFDVPETQTQHERTLQLLETIESREEFEKLFPLDTDDDSENVQLLHRTLLPFSSEILRPLTTPCGSSHSIHSILPTGSTSSESPAPPSLDGQGQGQGQVDTLLPGLNNCGECHTTLAVAKQVSKLGGDGALVRSLVGACNRFKIQDPDVCSGALERQGPVVAEVLRRIDTRGYPGKLLCSVRFGACSLPELKEARLDIPPPLEYGLDSESVKRKREARYRFKSGEDPIKVLHLADLHHDPEYQPGSEASCSKPLCCRPPSSSSSTPSTNSDPIKRPASKYGDFECDAPVSLIESMFQDVRARFGSSGDGEVKGIEFGVLSGDIVPHDVWLESVDSVKDGIERSVGLIDRGFEQGSKMIITVGNHDISPTNVFKPFPEDFDGSKHIHTGRTLSLEGERGDEGDEEGVWLYEHFADLLERSGWIQGSGARRKMVERKGSYAVRVRDGLKVVALNSMWGFAENWWLYATTDKVDVTGTLEWLIEELADSERRAERVWIVSHVSPNSPGVIPSWSRAYARIVDRFHLTIAAHLTGHSHHDELSFFYPLSTLAARNDTPSVFTSPASTTPISISYGSPSVTPFSFLNSGYRIYHVDPVTYSILEGETFIADIRRAMENGGRDEGPIEWQREYGFGDVYGPLPAHREGAVPLSLAWWDSVIDRFLIPSCSNDTTGDEDWQGNLDLLQKYIWYNTKSVRRPPKLDVLSDEVRERIVCYIRSGESLVGRDCSVKGG